MPLVGTGRNLPSAVAGRYHLVTVGHHLSAVAGRYHLTAVGHHPSAVAGRYHLAAALDCLAVVSSRAPAGGPAVAGGAERRAAARSVPCAGGTQGRSATWSTRGLAAR
jgi:hypothetical protein